MGRDGPVARGTAAGNPDDLVVDGEDRDPVALAGGYLGVGQDVLYLAFALHADHGNPVAGLPDAHLDAWRPCGIIPDMNLCGIGTGGG